MPRLTWAGPLDTASVERSRPQPRPWSRCRRRTASLSCPTRPGWAWPRFYSAERVPTLLVNPPVGWANTTGTTAQPTLWFSNHILTNCNAYRHIVTQIETFYAQWMTSKWLHTGFTVMMLCVPVHESLIGPQSILSTVRLEVFRSETRSVYFTVHTNILVL